MSDDDTSDYPSSDDSRRPPPPPPPPRSPKGWSDRVSYGRNGGGYAYRPEQLMCADLDALNAARDLGLDGDVETISVVDGDDHYLLHVGADDDVPALVAELRARGKRVEPNYVLFANPVYANPVYANPVYANPVYANPVYANPVYANPVYANPVYANGSGSFANPVYANPVYASPVYANPVYANPVYANAYICEGLRPSTARPAPAPEEPPAAYQPSNTARKVVVLDTGISAESTCPDMLQALSAEYPQWWEIPDGQDPENPEDGFLDPSSGHGTFIAGLVHQLAPGHAIVPVRVIEPFGDVAVSDVVSAIEELRGEQMLDEHTVVNMSFGGYADEEMDALSSAVRRVRKTGAVVVASAGNDATDRPLFPACLPDVVAVAALDPYGPAAYTNHGAWVDACAPGTDLVSAFYAYNGKMELKPMPGSADPDHYEQWARWTGSSFAAPVVAAALVRQMALAGGTAEDAVDRVVRSEGLFRMPGLGTVVNLSPAEPGCLAAD